MPPILSPNLPRIPNTDAILVDDFTSPCLLRAVPLNAKRHHSFDFSTTENVKAFAHCEITATYMDVSGEGSEGRKTFSSLCL